MPSGPVETRGRLRHSVSAGLGSQLAKVTQARSVFECGVSVFQ